MAEGDKPILNHENANAPKMLEAIYEWAQAQVNKLRGDAGNAGRQHDDLLVQRNDGFTVTNQAKNIAFKQKIDLQTAQNKAMEQMEIDTKNMGERAENLANAARKAQAAVPNFQKQTGATNVPGDDAEVKAYKDTLNSKEYVEAFQKDPEAFIKKLQEEYTHYHVPTGASTPAPQVGQKQGTGISTGGPK